MGFVLPGGSISNMTVMHSALNSRPRRPGSGHPTAFVSEDAHYSFMKGSITLGLGLDGLVLVRAGKDGKMDLADLRQKIETCLASGGDPYFVAATVGTTEVGVSDPVKEISELCAQYKVWFHIDGAIGGCRIFSGVNIDALL
jgi:glutamate/tyrosine decarboxylase-like PLP-dependent enzyme